MHALTRDVAGECKNVKKSLERKLHDQTAPQHIEGVSVFIATIESLLQVHITVLYLEVLINLVTKVSVTKVLISLKRLW